MTSFGIRTLSFISCTSSRFSTATDDGIGDFPGLISKLDYIADLGVNTHLAIAILSVAAA